MDQSHKKVPWQEVSAAHGERRLTTVWAGLVWLWVGNHTWTVNDWGGNLMAEGRERSEDLAVLEDRNAVRARSDGGAWFFLFARW